MGVARGEDRVYIDRACVLVFDLNLLLVARRSACALATVNPPGPSTLAEAAANTFPRCCDKP